MKQPFLLAVMAVLLLSCVACKNKQTTGVVQLPHQEEEANNSHCRLPLLYNMEKPLHSSSAP